MFSLLALDALFLTAAPATGRAIHGSLPFPVAVDGDASLGGHHRNVLSVLALDALGLGDDAEVALGLLAVVGAQNGR